MKKLLSLMLLAGAVFALPAETIKTKIIENGGAGSFKAVAVKDSEMPDFVIYRPQNLSEAAAGKELPVLMWAKGACFDTNIDYERFLNEIASHGYIVMAIGEMQDDRSDREIGHTESSELKRGLDWLLVQASLPGSDYYNVIDSGKVAADGHSCGGAQVLYNAADPRLSTCLIMNAGMGDIEMAGASRESLHDLHTPMLYVTGGTDDIAYLNAEKDYQRITHVPVVWANHPASGHGGTYGNPNGGDYARIVIDWLDWQLKDDPSRSATFSDGVPEGYEGWSVQSKNFAK